MRNVIFFSGEMIPIARLTQQMDLSEDSGHPPHPPSKGRGRAGAWQIDNLRLCRNMVRGTVTIGFPETEFYGKHIYHWVRYLHMETAKQL